MGTGERDDGRETAPRARFRRRRLLVDPRYQVRVGIVAVAITLVLLVLLNTSLLLEGGVGESEATGGGLVIAGSLVFLAGVFLVSLLETHRTAGAARSLIGTMERFRRGDLSARARLRRGDHLQDVAAAFNALAGTLHERRSERVERLEQIAAELDRGTPPAAAAAAIRQWIAGSSSPASENPLARSAQASHAPQGRPPSSGS